MRIALVLFGVNENCGGAERFFADFYDLYNKQIQPQNELYFVTDHNSLNVFQKKLNKLSGAKKIILTSNINNRFKNFIEAVDFCFKLLTNKIDVLHVASYVGTTHYHRLNLLQKLPHYLRPKIVVNIVDAELPYSLGNKLHPKNIGDNLKYTPLFQNIKIDAVYTWYNLFKEFAENNQLIKSKPYIEAIKTRFSAINKRIVPAATRQKEIIYAARLIAPKQPLFFVEAIHILTQTIDSTLLQGWKFRMFGKGELEQEVISKINLYKLNHIVSLEYTNDMAKVICKSSCFVSTMDYENFPSQAMNEAMAGGNAIIARNVGQTSYFVKDKVNGFLLNEDTPEDLARILTEYIQNNEHYSSMGLESIKLTTQVHTPENFISAIDLFWTKVYQL